MKFSLEELEDVSGGSDRGETWTCPICGLIFDYNNFDLLKEFTLLLKN